MNNVQGMTQTFYKFVYWRKDAVAITKFGTSENATVLLVGMQSCIKAESGIAEIHSHHVCNRDYLLAKVALLSASCRD